MESELTSIATGLGGGLASFLASWMAIMKRAKSSADSNDALRQRVEAIEQSRAEEKKAQAVMLSETRAAIEKVTDGLRSDLAELRNQSRSFVNDEEFQAYVRSTTEAVNGLTEKVGRAAGALEAWQRHQAR